MEIGFGRGDMALSVEINQAMTIRNILILVLQHGETEADKTEEYREGEAEQTN